MYFCPKIKKKLGFKISRRRLFEVEQYKSTDDDPLMMMMMTMKTPTETFWSALDDKSREGKVWRTGHSLITWLRSLSWSFYPPSRLKLCSHRQLNVSRAAPVYFLSEFWDRRRLWIKVLQVWKCDAIGAHGSCFPQASSVCKIYEIILKFHAMMSARCCAPPPCVISCPGAEGLSASERADPDQPHLQTKQTLPSSWHELLFSNSCEMWC